MTILFVQLDLYLIDICVLNEINRKKIVIIIFFINYRLVYKSGLYFKFCLDTKLIIVLFVNMR